MNVTIVAAHPDDEVLGCGGTIAKHVAQGDNVSAVWFTDGVGSRATSMPDAVKVRRAECEAAGRVLGIKSWYWFGEDRSADQQLDLVPLSALADRITDALSLYDSQIVYTHWPGDLNQDHRAIAEATLIATRLWKGKISQLLAFEVPESTAQAFHGTAFSPTVFVDITDTVDQKCRALACYESERRELPHPRAEVMVRAHAATRGATAGTRYAEAFCLLREVWR